MFFLFYFNSQDIQHRNADIGIKISLICDWLNHKSSNTDHVSVDLALYLVELNILNEFFKKSISEHHTTSGRHNSLSRLFKYRALSLQSVLP